MPYGVNWTKEELFSDGIASPDSGIHSSHQIAHDEMKDWEIIADSSALLVGFGAAC
jgi:hypothetical protein